MFDPDLTHLGLLDCVERTPLVLFAAVPNLPVNSVVDWPDPDDHVGFVDTAVKAGATILYVERSALTPERIAGEEDLLGTNHPLLVELRDHADETTSLLAMWVLQGIGHALVVNADWWIGLDERLVTAAGAVADQEHASRLAERSALIVELAELPGFATAKNESARSAVIDAHLGGLLQVQGGARLVQEVKDHFDAHVLPGIEKDLADKARELISQKTPKKDVAAKLGIGATKLDQLLARYPAS